MEHYVSRAKFFSSILYLNLCSFLWHLDISFGSLINNNWSGFFIQFCFMPPCFWAVRKNNTAHFRSYWNGRFQAILQLQDCTQFLLQWGEFLSWSLTNSQCYAKTNTWSHGFFMSKSLLLFLGPLEIWPSAEMYPIATALRFFWVLFVKYFSDHSICIFFFNPHHNLDYSSIICIL